MQNLVNECDAMFASRFIQKKLQEINTWLPFLFLKFFSRGTLPPLFGRESKSFSEMVFSFYLLLITRGNRHQEIRSVIYLFFWEKLHFKPYSLGDVTN
jgi:hypothetical protein